MRYHSVFGVSLGDKRYSARKGAELEEVNSIYHPISVTMHSVAVLEMYLFLQRMTPLLSEDKISPSADLANLHTGRRLELGTMF
jgi:hypothetical protein